MAIVGKLPPVTWPGKLETSLSTQDRPDGSDVNGTVTQRAIRMASNAALSWITKILWETGLTSLFPMMPSVQLPPGPVGPVILYGGLNSTPALASAPGIGERCMTSTLLPITPEQTGSAMRSSFAR